MKPQVQVIYEAIGGREVTARDVAELTGLQKRVATTRLCLLRDRGHVILVRTEQRKNALVNVYVRDDHPLACSSAEHLCHLSNSWLKKA